MIRIITDDGSKYVYDDVYDVNITSDVLQITYQHPEDDAYICSFNLNNVICMRTTEALTIKFNVGGLKNENN